MKKENGFNSFNTEHLIEQQNFLFGKAGCASKINTKTIYDSTLIYFSNVVICLACFILFVPNEKHVIEEGIVTILSLSKRAKNNKK